MANVYGTVTVYSGGDRGAFPYCNSLVVRGRDAVLVVDPSLCFVDAAPPADLVLISHAHEDHLAGLASYDVPVHVHEADLSAVRSRDVLAANQGLAPAAAACSVEHLRKEFHISEQRDASAFVDGEVFDLGGRTVTVVHLPGHTPGHSGFLVEPDGFMFVADIDLSSFGPYYGDINSDLADFDSSLRRCASIEARWYGTSHQKGVIDGAVEFRQRLVTFAGVIDRRDARVLERLSEPLTVEEILTHRLVYRAHIDGDHVAPVERRTVIQHLLRLVELGRVERVGPDRFRAV